jgi:serine/threonine-protein kinase
VRVDIGEVVGGRYEVRRVLEVQARSTLLEAVARERDEFVVVEVFRRFHLAHENEPFLRELERAAALRNHHVARVLGSGSDGRGANYVVTEPPEGESLETLLRRQGPLPLVRIVELMLQVCDALAEMHAAHLVHQDLSPETLFLTRLPDGSPCMKLRGLGARRALHAITGGQLCGTSHFTAPEQLASRSGIDRRTDVWALGATIYELATGHRPFSRRPSSSRGRCSPPSPCRSAKGVPACRRPSAGP